MAHKMRKLLFNYVCSFAAIAAVLVCSAPKAATLEVSPQDAGTVLRLLDLGLNAEVQQAQDFAQRMQRAIAEEAQAKQETETKPEEESTE